MAVDADDIANVVIPDDNIANIVIADEGSSSIRPSKLCFLNRQGNKLLYSVHVLDLLHFEPWKRIVLR